MKITVEIDNRYLDIVELLLTTQADTKKEEKYVQEIIQSLKDNKEPVEINTDEIEDKETKNSLPVAIAYIIIAQLCSRKEKERKQRNKPTVQKECTDKHIGRTGR